MRQASVFLLAALCLPAFAGVRLSGPTDTAGVRGYAVKELRRVLNESGVKELHEAAGDDIDVTETDLVVIGTRESNPLIARLIEESVIELKERPQGYSMKCAAWGTGKQVLVVAGADDEGALWAVRDLEHFELSRDGQDADRLSLKPFTRRDYPRILQRGHWTWGYYVPDPEGFIETISRWKFNQLVIWRSRVPQNARRLGDYARERGVSLIWGVGTEFVPVYGFDLPPDFDHGEGKDVMMCTSDPDNLDNFKEQILRRVREEVVPTRCDGIYLQAFMEFRKCRCEDCAGRTMGELLRDFYNPIVAGVKDEFPDLWLGCGVDAMRGSHDPEYAALKELDRRATLYWENCVPNSGIRGEGESFGHLYKTGYGAMYWPVRWGGRKKLFHWWDVTPADCPWLREEMDAWRRRESREQRRAWQERIGEPAGYLANEMQAWSRRLLSGPSAEVHAALVWATCPPGQPPFVMTAFAEALWNPQADAEKLAGAIMAFQYPDALANLDTLLNDGSVKHAGVGAKIVLATRYSDDHSGGGEKALVDGMRAVDMNVDDPAWQGYWQTNMDVVVDLGTNVAIRTLSTRFLYGKKESVYLPEIVEYAVSGDGKEFRDVEKIRSGLPWYGVTLAVMEADDVIPPVNHYEVCDIEENARYVRVRVAPAVRLGSDSEKEKGWLMVDEILINEDERL